MGSDQLGRVSRGYLSGYPGVAGYQVRRGPEEDEEGGLRDTRKGLREGAGWFGEGRPKQMVEATRVWLKFGRKDDVTGGGRKITWIMEEAGQTWE